MKRTLESFRSLAALLLVLCAVSVRAELIAVDTPSTVLNISSITLGDYQIVATPGPSNLIDGTPDFIVVNEESGGSLVLSRVDGAMFDLDSIIVQGSCSASIGGVVIYPNFGGFQEYFVDLKGVTSVAMTPVRGNSIGVCVFQFSAFHDAPHPHDALIWAASDTGDILSVNTVTGTTVTIGNAGVTLTDIAFDSNGDLWGVSRFGGLYSINTTNGAATLVSSLNVFELNALVSDGAGGLFAADPFGDFYGINTATGVASLIGNMGVGSAGDLEFANSTLYLSAIGDPSNPSIPNQLWTVNPATGAASLVGDFGVPNMFGLAFEDGVMWGLEGTNVYSVDLATGAATLSTSYFGPSAAFGASSAGTSLLDLPKLVSLGDVNNSGSADLAVLRVGTIVAEIRDGWAGAPINNIAFLSDAFTPITMAALPDSDGNGIAELVVLARRISDGRIVAEIRNVSGAESARQVWFADNHSAVTMKVIEGDADNNGVAELAVLSTRNSDGRIAVEVKNAFGATNPNTVWYMSGNTPVDLEVVPDKDANGIPEVAVLSSRDSDGRVVVEVKNAIGATNPTAVWFMPGNTAIDLIAVDDKDANGIPEVAVLSSRDSDGRNVVEIKNASGPTSPTAVWFMAGNTATNVVQIQDADSNGVTEVAVLSVRQSDGRIVVEAKNVTGPTNPNTIWYSSEFTSHGLTTIADTDGNGIEEALVLMIRDSDGRILVEGRNAAGTPTPNQYWFSP